MAFTLRHLPKFGRKLTLRCEKDLFVKSGQTSFYHTKKSFILNSTSSTLIQLHKSIHNTPKEKLPLNDFTDTFQEMVGAQSHADSTLTFETALETSIPCLEPTLASLGLGGWSPKGLVQSALELLHVQLDVPWWTAIVIGTICVRIAIFPLVIASQRNIANLNNHMPTIQRFQDRITEARATGDVQKMMQSSNEMMAFMKTNNVNPLKNMLVPFAQLPIFISVFTGLRQMAVLPVASMQTGGLWWFCNLTVPDPTWALPALTALTLLITIEAGVDGVKASQTGSTQIKWFLRCMPFVSLPVMLNFPAAMLCYWFTSNTFSLCQVLLLKIPAVRDFFGIPQLTDHSKAYPLKKSTLPGPQPSFMQSFRESMKNIELAHEIEERQKHEALKMKQPQQGKEAKFKDKL